MNPTATTSTLHLAYVVIPQATEQYGMVRYGTDKRAVLLCPFVGTISYSLDGLTADRTRQKLAQSCY